MSEVVVVEIGDKTMGFLFYMMALYLMARAAAWLWAPRTN